MLAALRADDVRVLVTKVNVFDVPLQAHLVKVLQKMGGMVVSRLGTILNQSLLTPIFLFSKANNSVPVLPRL